MEESDTTPQQVCRQAGYCDEKHAAALNVPRHRTLLLTDSVFMNFGSGMLCQVCMTLANIAKGLLGTARNAAVSALNEACDATLIFAAPCRQLVSQNAGTLIDLLTQTIPISEICKMLKLCNGQHASLFLSVPSGITLLPKLPRLRVLDGLGDGLVVGLQGIMNLAVADIGALIADVTARDDIGLK